MYGKKKFRPQTKPVEQVNNVPTYLCGKCGVLKAINSPFSELSLVENKQAICYIKMCGSCTELLRTWIKG